MTARRVLLALGIGLAVLVALAVVDLAVLDARIKHVSVHFPKQRDGETFVVVGSDSRAGLPESLAKVVGTAAKIHGDHADVVLLVHLDGAKTTVVALPRDLMVSPQPFQDERLTLAWSESPQALVDGLCRTLGVSATHLVAVSFSSFESIVNALGGITVTIAQPIRDPSSHLLITGTGAQHLDGAQALALVRSRTPELEIDSRWVAQSDGAVDRTQWSGKVLQAILARVEATWWDPISDQEVAWAGTGGLTTDDGTGLRQLAALARTHGAIVDIPAKQFPGTINVLPDAATSSTLAKAGLGGHCTTR
jgi:LCP family protein required for cell wall assembly